MLKFREWLEKSNQEQNINESDNSLIVLLPDYENIKIKTKLLDDTGDRIGSEKYEWKVEFNGKKNTLIVNDDGDLIDFTGKKEDVMNLFVVICQQLFIDGAVKSR